MSISKAFLAAFLLTVPGFGQAANQQMTLAVGGKYLQNTITGKPVFIVGDSPWVLPNQISDADVRTYLTDRAARGYNAVIVEAADNTYQDNAPNNYYGYAPFSGADFTNPVTNFWAHVDSVVRTAEALGITVWLDPAFVGLTTSDGYLSSYQSASSSTLTNFGTFVGNRYKGYSNIVWLLGGDWNPGNLSASRLNYLAAAIKAADPNHLITLEACRACSPANQSTMDAWSQSTAMDLNFVYPTYSALQTSCESNYARSGALPALMGEGWYENEHSITTLQLREQAYWATLSGCTLGVFFGNSPIWCMNSAKTVAGCYNSVMWQSQLGSAGSVSQQYMGHLMRSRQFWKMVPDSRHSVLKRGYGSGITISVASCTSDGITCIVYDPVGNKQAPQIEMGHWSGTVRVWWYNPTTAATSDLGTFTNSGLHTFTPPDGNDWVLVADLASANLPLPGRALANSGHGVRATRAMNRQ